MNLAERIDDFLEERAQAEDGWDDQVSAFRDFVETELQEQREACGLALHKVAEEKGWRSIFQREAIMIVLNAGEKRDE